MPIQWSGLSPELLLQLDRQKPEPLRVQLECGLREAIRSGRLPVGERLPSSRELSRTLGVSRGLVQECFVQLQAEGYLTAQVGSATRVAPHAGTATAVSAPAPTVVRDASRLIADFVPAVPDLSSFPRGDWQWAVRETCRNAPNAAFGYGEPGGSRTLRTVLAGYLSRVRGAAADPQRLLICTGFCQGLNLVLRVLAGTGVRAVGFEDPGYDDTSRTAAAWAGVDMVPVPVDEYGIDVAALDASRAQAVVVTPAHQWPTGVVLAPDRRRQLIEWADRRQAMIIEDDYDAEFRYDRDPVGVLQGLAPDRVFALGTVSKSLAPTLRLGWVLCPPAMSARVAEEKLASDRGSPGLDQLVIARLIESGRFDRHLRRMRASYARRRDTLVAALAEHAPGVRVTGLAAGFHAVAHLPGHVAEQAVVDAARARSVGLYGMSRQRFTRAATPPQLVLGFGNLNERAIRAGIAAVGDLLRAA